MDRWQENPHLPSSKDEPTDVQVSIDDGVRIVVDNNVSYAEQLKKSWWTRTSTHRMGGRQFGMAGMLGLMTGVAVVLSFAQWFGFEAFFAFLGNLGLTFAPFVIFLILILFPGIDRKNRKWVAIGLGVLALLPGAVMIVVTTPWHSPISMPNSIARYYGPTAGQYLFAYGIAICCVWTPQILWLWILFSWRPIRRASTPPPEESREDKQE